MPTATIPENAYLAGNFGPVDREVTAFDLRVEGRIPVELEGRYLRNGPNPIAEVDPATHHWFIGDGMVHGVRLRGGKAEWYRNRYVGSRHVSEVRGQPDIGGRNWNDSPGGPNTNAGGFAGTTWAMVEAGGCPVEMTYDLDTVARNDFFGTLPGAFTAHPKIDPDSGEMHAMVYAWAEWLDHVQYVVHRDDCRKSIGQADHSQLLVGILATGRGNDSAWQMCSKRQDLADKGFQINALVRLGPKTHAPQVVQMIDVNCGVMGADQTCGRGLIHPDKAMHECRIDGKTSLGKGGEARPCGDAFRVNQGSVKVEQ